MSVGAKAEMKLLAECTRTPARQSILILLPTYLPGYKAGGPIRSIANLVAALGGEVRFRIVTLDRDLGEKAAFSDVVPGRWVRVGQADVKYLGPGFAGLLATYELLRSLDENTVLYLNSFFGRRFSMLAIFMRWCKLCRPGCLVLAPRGEFSPGAFQFKHGRKALYVRICGWLGLYRNLVWHASSGFEETDIRRHFPELTNLAVAGVIPALETGTVMGSRVAIASDITSLPGAAPRTSPKVPGRLNVVFISRLAPMKNLTAALRMLEGILGDVSFDIYGPAEDADYWGECLRLIAALPANIRVRYWGEVVHERIGQILGEHDLFLFPTLGENFGHVIGESFLAGCPVLTSDQTPWRGLEAAGVGWDLPLSEPRRFCEVLQQCVRMGSNEHAMLSERARAFGVASAQNPGILEENRVLFRAAFRKAISA